MLLLADCRYAGGLAFRAVWKTGYTECCRDLGDWTAGKGQEQQNIAHFSSKVNRSTYKRWKSNVQRGWQQSGYRYNNGTVGCTKKIRYSILLTGMGLGRALKRIFSVLLRPVEEKHSTIVLLALLGKLCRSHALNLSSFRSFARRCDGALVSCLLGMYVINVLFYIKRTDNINM